MMDRKIRHLEIIQAARRHELDNSMRVKGFTILLLAGTLALLLRGGESVISTQLPIPIGLPLLLIVGFLFLLDFYFIRQSDLLMILYNRVRIRSEGNVDFSLEVTQYSDDLKRYYDEYFSFPITAASVLYGSLGVILIIGMLTIMPQTD